MTQDPRRARRGRRGASAARTAAAVRAGPPRAGPSPSPGRPRAGRPRRPASAAPAPAARSRPVPAVRPRHRSARPRSATPRPPTRRCRHRPAPQARRRSATRPPRPRPSPGAGRAGLRPGSPTSRAHAASPAPARGRLRRRSATRPTPATPSARPTGPAPAATFSAAPRPQTAPKRPPAPVTPVFSSPARPHRRVRRRARRRAARPASPSGPRPVPTRPAAVRAARRGAVPAGTPTPAPSPSGRPPRPRPPPSPVPGRPVPSPSRRPARRPRRAVPRREVITDGPPRHRGADARPGTRRRRAARTPSCSVSPFRQLVILDRRRAAASTRRGPPWPRRCIRWCSSLAAMPVAGVAFVLAVGRRDGISLDAWLLHALRLPAQPRTGSSRPTARSPRPRRGSRTTAGRGDKLPLPAPLRLPAKGITGDGLVDLGPDGTTALVAASTVAFGLRTPGEQNGLVAGFGRWLNSLDAPVQIVVRAQRVDLTTVADRIHDLAAEPAAPGAGAGRPARTSRSSTTWPRSGSCCTGRSPSRCATGAAPATPAPRGGRGGPRPGRVRGPRHRPRRARRGRRPSPPASTPPAPAAGGSGARPRRHPRHLPMREVTSGEPARRSARRHSAAATTGSGGGAARGAGRGRGRRPVVRVGDELHHDPGGDRLPGRGRRRAGWSRSCPTRAGSTWPCTSSRSRRRSPRTGCASSAAGSNPSRRQDAAKGRLDDPELDAAAFDAAELATRLARGEARLFRLGLYLTVHAASPRGAGRAGDRGPRPWPRRCCWTPPR